MTASRNDARPSSATTLSYTRDGSRIVGDTWRISPLTSKVVRIEYSPSGTFIDAPSTFIVNRDIEDSSVNVRDRPATSAGGTPAVIVESPSYRLTYDGEDFTSTGLMLEVLGGVTNYHSVWRFEQDLSLPAHHQRVADALPAASLDGNFGGAARTLDLAYGRIPLEDGINSRNGYAVIDDSHSMLIGEDGHLKARPAEAGYRDLILFAGGRDAVGNLRDFYALAGPQPVIPKFALGNWWSRYHVYTEESYLALMDEFAAHDLPLSVAVIDMDWHLVDIDPRWGSGWTGYTWNPELFPDPERFQRELHERGLAVTLNVHPADGVRGHEDAYPRVAAAMGREADGTPITFDVNDPEFMRAYFDVLHRELEDMGTDFWWIDWQQGPYSSIPGVDPLWVLNHEHFRDNEEKKGEGRGLTFSRYAGPGSHRYPVGFSGDTVINWESLAFQPEFTSAGANIGYGWWSHDIGGHMFGYKDDELTARWVQFGVFSPIMRLHSSNSPFSGKEPWNFSRDAYASITRHMRLRHRLLPYLHSMNHRAAHEGRVIAEPMYFAYPELTDQPGQYMFGSELLVAPIVQPASPVTEMGSVAVALPEGRWVDIFTGRSYRGGRFIQAHRTLDEIPVFLKAGGFLPLQAWDAGVEVTATAELPALTVQVAGGAPGEFVLREEVAGDAASTWVETTFTLDPSAGVLTVAGPADSAGREITFELLGFASAATFTVVLDADGRAEVRDDVLGTVGNSGVEDADAILEIVKRAHVGFRLKEQIMRAITADDATVSSLAALGLEPDPASGLQEDYNRASAELVAAIAEVLEA